MYGETGEPRHAPALTLVASSLWPLTWNFRINPQLIRIIETPAVGNGGPDDLKTRNDSLTALRLTQSQESDVVVAIGGRRHSESGFNPGVLEDLCVARWRSLPCFVIASLGGIVGGLTKEALQQFSVGNKLDSGEGSGVNDDSEVGRMASCKEDIPSVAGDLLAHLVAHREEFLQPAAAGQSWIRARIPIAPKQIAFQNLTIAKADVPKGLVRDAAKRFRQVFDEIKKPDPDIAKLAQLLQPGSP
jgi:hypothetical protein